MLAFGSLNRDRFRCRYWTSAIDIEPTPPFIRRRVDIRMRFPVISYLRRVYPCMCSLSSLGRVFRITLSPAAKKLKRTGATVIGMYFRENGLSYTWRT